MPATAVRPSALLALERIDLTFGGVIALSAVDLDVADGEICAVIGPNGAGKSSLLNVISGLYRPKAGRITFEGRSYAQLRAGALARLGIARTFQNLALFNGMSVVDNIVMGRVAAVRATAAEQVLGLPRARREEREGRERADAILTFLGLARVRGKIVSTLPYGLQKRVELGRALVAQPKLLLLDEPLAGMTVVEKREMADFILDINEQYRTTIVLIEHDVGVVMNISDHIAVLDYGRKIADGTPDVVQNDQVVIDAYLGVDHDELLQKVPSS
jgi:branched-chain amino acid transport system ATP-binding protein